jgi:gliding motility-associated-like protein
MKKSSSLRCSQKWSLSSLMFNNSLRLEKIIGAFAVLISSICFGQVNVAVTGANNTTPNLDQNYTSLAQAINALNSVTSFTGPVTLSCSSGNEVAPAGGYEIKFSASTSISSNLTIKSVEPGAVTIKASAAHAIQSKTDALFKIIGCDWVTISGFNMIENESNNTFDKMTEWGVALLKKSVTDGAQNNTIEDNIISLNRSYVNSIGIYSNVRHTNTDPTSNQSPTVASGSNSGNKIHRNTLSNSNFAIVFIGAQSGSTDQGNDIGGSSLSNGNKISNCGGNKIASGNYTGMTTSAALLIYMAGQTTPNVSHNKISSIEFNTTSSISIIYINGSSSSGSDIQSITNNEISFSSSGTSLLVRAIHYENSNSIGLENVTVNISGNIVHDCSSATSFNGILHSGSGKIGFVNIKDNFIHNIQLTGAKSAFAGIENAGDIIQKLTIESNKFGDQTNNAVRFTQETNGKFSFIHIQLAPQVVNIAKNSFTKVVNDVPAKGVHNYLYFRNISDATKLTLKEVNISENVFSDMKINNIAEVHVIFFEEAPMQESGVINITENTITNISKEPNGNPNQSLYLVRTFVSKSSASPSSSRINYLNNTFTYITNYGVNAKIEGIHCWDGNEERCPSKQIKNNTFSNWNGELGINCIESPSWGFGSVNEIIGNTFSKLSGAGVGAIGIGYLESGNNPLTISNNTFYEFKNKIVLNAAGTVRGISSSNKQTPIHIFNNSFRNFLAQADPIFGVRGITVAGTATYRIFNNQIDSLSCDFAGLYNDVVGIEVLDGSYGNVGSPDSVFIYNNRIGNLFAPKYKSYNAVMGIHIDANSVVDCYYNTIYLNNLSSTASNFGASGICVGNSAKVKLKNNLVRITGTAKGNNGRIVAFRVKSGAANVVPANYEISSNNNMFFAGTPSTSNLIYAEGGYSELANTPPLTNQKQTLEDYKTFMTQIDQASTTGDPAFLSLEGSNSANFLKIDVNGDVSSVSNAGISIDQVTTDFEGDTRESVPDIGADEFVISNCTSYSISVSEKSNVSCFGLSDGKVSVSIKSGTAPYIYSWSNGITATTFAQNLNAGIYKIKVSDKNGCVDSTSVEITQPADIVITETINNVICGVSLGSVTTETSGGTGSYLFSWTMNNSNSNSISGLTPGNYTITITDDNSCKKTENYNVKAEAPLTVNVSPSESNINFGDTLLLNASGALNYTWSPSTSLSCSDCSSPFATPTSTTTYTVIASDDFGCIDSATVVVNVDLNCAEIYVPTIFSPNGSGDVLNEKLLVQGIDNPCIKSYSFDVFDRWGNRVFSSENIHEHWDGTYKGKAVNTGVYFYQLRTGLIDNTTKELNGTCTVVR